MSTVLLPAPLSIEELVAVTNLGDSSLLLAIGAAVPAWLWAIGARTEARAWLIAAFVCVAAIAVLKLPFLVCTPASAFSPSGHAALATQVYGSLAILGANGRSRWWWGGLLTAAAVVVALVAWTRVALLAHSPLEVMMGLAVGGAGLGLFLAGCRNRRPAGVSLMALLMLLVLSLGLFYGTSLDTTAALRWLADFLRTTTGLCR